MVVNPSLPSDVPLGLASRAALQAYPSLALSSLWDLHIPGSRRPWGTPCLPDNIQNMFVLSLRCPVASVGPYGRCRAPTPTPSARRGDDPGLKHKIWLYNIRSGSEFCKVSPDISLAFVDIFKGPIPGAQTPKIWGYPNQAGGTGGESLLTIYDPLAPPLAMAASWG